VSVNPNSPATLAAGSGSVPAFFEPVQQSRPESQGIDGRGSNATQYTLVADDLSFEPYAIVLPRGDASFRVAVNRGLSEIYRSTEIVEIFRGAFGGLEPTPMLIVVYGLGAYPN